MLLYTRANKLYTITSYIDSTFQSKMWAAASIVAILIYACSSISTIVAGVTIVLFLTEISIVTIYGVTSKGMTQADTLT